MHAVAWSAGMAVFDYDARPEFLPLQVLTTRNVNDWGLVGWFMGGLHHQVEHHIFPYVPRHKLGEVRGAPLFAARVLLSLCVRRLSSRVDVCVCPRVVRHAPYPGAQAR
jgi:hypothetical protein